MYCRLVSEIGWYLDWLAQRKLKTESLLLDFDPEPNGILGDVGRGKGLTAQPLMTS